MRDRLGQGPGRAPLAAALVGLAGALLGACAGPAAPRSEPASVPQAAPTVAATASAPGPASSRVATDQPSTAAGEIDACTLLTRADIKEITGFAVAEVIPNPMDTIYPQACEWRVEGAAWQVVLGVSAPGGQTTWDSLVPYMKGTRVSGLGDEAFLPEMGGDLMVRRGDTFVDLQYVAVGAPKDTQERLAQRVLEHLP